MARFRKRPPEVEAEQWYPHANIHGVKLGALLSPIHEASISQSSKGCRDGRLWGWLDNGSREGEIVSPGDFIVTDRDGRQTRMSPDEFALEYEAVATPTASG